MNKVILIILISICPLSTLAQQQINEKLVVAKKFMKMVFDIRPFDSISMLTTLNKSSPNARSEYASAYLLIVNLQLEINRNKYTYADLSYVPYNFLNIDQRTLVYEKFIDGIPSDINLEDIYAVYDKKSLLTYIEYEKSKISGLKSMYSQGGADYIHHLNVNTSNQMYPEFRQDQKSLKNQSISGEQKKIIIRNFLSFTRDSLNSQDRKIAIKNFINFRKKIDYVDTFNIYTAYVLAEQLKDDLLKIPLEKIVILNYKDLRKKQKKALCLKSEELEFVFALVYKNSVFNFIYLENDKVRYFYTLKNLGNKNVFVPFKYQFL
jgi:hypothetical protein